MTLNYDVGITVEGPGGAVKQCSGCRLVRDGAVARDVPGTLGVRPPQRAGGYVRGPLPCLLRAVAADDDGTGAFRGASFTGADFTGANAALEADPSAGAAHRDAPP